MLPVLCRIHTLILSAELKTLFFSFQTHPLLKKKCKHFTGALFSCVRMSVHSDFSGSPFCFLLLHFFTPLRFP